MGPYKLNINTPVIFEPQLKRREAKIGTAMSQVASVALATQLARTQPQVDQVRQLTRDLPPVVDGWSGPMEGETDVVSDGGGATPCRTPSSITQNARTALRAVSGPDSARTER